MFAIAIKETPSKPWVFITYHKGPRAKAQESARRTEDQERGILNHPKAVVRVFSAEDWDRGRGQRARARPRQAPEKKEKREARPMTMAELFSGLEKEDEA